MSNTPRMTRQHFQFIADVIHQQPDLAPRRIIAAEFARALKRTNPAFDRDTFLHACGVDQ